jgi:amino acid transporter
VFEIAVFLVLAVFLIVQAGSNNTAQVFTTHYSPTGLTGVIGGSVFTLLAFGGFEGAAPLAEETRDPRRTIQRGAAGHAADRRALRVHHLRRHRGCSASL